MVVRNWPQFAEGHWVYAVLSLTVVRMLPVATALIGARLSAASVIFMGWFGPRGLASIVLGLVYVEQEMHLPGEPTIRLAVIVTVMLSIFAHGMSAMPGISLYERKTRIARRGCAGASGGQGMKTIRIQATRFSIESDSRDTTRARAQLPEFLN